MWTLSPENEPPWDETVFSSVYPAKKPLTKPSDVKDAVMLALEVLTRDPGATVDPLPLELRQQHGLMDWAQVSRPALPRLQALNPKPRHVSAAQAHGAGAGGRRAASATEMRLRPTHRGPLIAPQGLGLRAYSIPSSRVLIV